MTKEQLNYDFVCRRTRYLDGFFVAPNKMLTRKKVKGVTEFRFTDFEDINLETKIVGKTLDDVWNYKIGDKTIGEYLSEQENYNIVNEWE